MNLGLWTPCPRLFLPLLHHNKSGETGDWKVEQEDGRAVGMPECVTIFATVFVIAVCLLPPLYGSLNWHRLRV